MECYDVDKVRPLDELLDDSIREFDSGRDTACDKDLDRMIWKLGDYENEEPPQEALEYMEDTPIEDELVEKTMIVGGHGRASFREVGEAEDSFFTGEQLATASSIGSETREKRTTVARGAKATQQTAAARSRTPGKKKK
jgi:hypothetical protein